MRRQSSGRMGRAVLSNSTQGHGAIRLTIRPMIFAALVAHLRIHRIQAAGRFRIRWIIFEQTALDWIKALGNLPRSTFLGALFVGLQESALEDESAADQREADDDQRDTQSTHFTTAKMGILSRAAAAPNALFPLGAARVTAPAAGRKESRRARGYLGDSPIRTNKKGSCKAGPHLLALHKETVRKTRQRLEEKGVISIITHRQG
jgi:hypothetical protein